MIWGVRDEMVINSFDPIYLCFSLSFAATTDSVTDSGGHSAQPLNRNASVAGGRESCLPCPSIGPRPLTYYSSYKIVEVPACSLTFGNIL